MDSGLNESDNILDTYFKYYLKFNRFCATAESEYSNAYPMEIWNR